MEKFIYLKKNFLKIVMISLIGCLNLLVLNLFVLFVSAEEIKVATDIANDSVQIIVRENIKLYGKYILLGDIVKVDNCDYTLKTHIENVNLGRVPRLGEEKKLARRTIIASLESKKWFPDNVQLFMPDSIVVRRDSQNILNDMLKRLFENYIAEQLNDDNSINENGNIPSRYFSSFNANYNENIAENRFRVTNFRSIGSRVFPDGVLEFDVARRNKGDLKGRVNLSVVVYVDGSESGKISLSGIVHRNEKVVYVKKSMKRGDILKRSDLSTRIIESSKSSNNFIGNIKNVAGMCLRQSVRRGIILKTDMVKRPFAVKRGDRVRLIAKSGRLKVMARGIVKNSASLNEQVQVQNVRSKKIITGRVISPSTVEVVL